MEEAREPSMNKRITHVLVATAMWSFCMLLIGAVFPHFGIQLLGEFERPLAEWLPWLLVLFVGTTGALVVRLRMQARGQYQNGAAGGETGLPLRSGGNDPVPLLRATGMAGAGSGGGSRLGETGDRERSQTLRREVESGSSPSAELTGAELPLGRPRPLRTTVQLTPERVAGIVRPVTSLRESAVEGDPPGTVGLAVSPSRQGLWAAPARARDGRGERQRALAAAHSSRGPSRAECRTGRA